MAFVSLTLALTPKGKEPHDCGGDRVGVSLLQIRHLDMPAVKISVRIPQERRSSMSPAP